MTADRFIAKLKKFGYTPHNAHKLLGIGRTSIYRIANGTAEVPVVVERLILMLERHGIPEEFKA